MIDSQRNRRNSLVKQVNDILCMFRTVGTVVKVKHMKAYGNDLRNLRHDIMEAIYVAWRKGMRPVWRLPGNAHYDILPVINDCP